jgi:hypothetical protein
MVRGRRTYPGGACTNKRSRAMSSQDPREVEGCPIPTKKLYRQEEARSKLQYLRFHLPQGFTYPRDSKISGAWKTSPPIHCTLVLKKVGASIPVGATRGNVRYTSGVSCPPVAKVFESTRRKTSVGRDN